ncbi:hypothetical protein IMG5_081960 [Ichthyophthirius multifiliis]|uniref:Furin n=1 Tax=Ichthyophthirius multifiliis TaxID=5932 RepID=G0QQP0_ICHMU|nr:hypothetical protein IMG5_081960 [Ichthyophthirius multifiliis]EGR32464.1 hypothetical protein IMG5_081960 [Ichthyophthirius multifiliis]|eukprot:XP_004036450.1 hypothetical protein IMG5_081960 [Ichthyophthirius multifiliis]
MILDRLIEAVDKNAYFIETKQGRPKLFILNRLRREYQIIDLIDLYNLVNNGIYKIPRSKTLSFSIYSYEAIKSIVIQQKQKVMFNNNYIAFYETPFFDDDCNQIMILSKNIQKYQDISTNNIIVFDDYNKQYLAYMIYKGKKYKMAHYPQYKCMYVIDIDNDIALIQLIFSGDTVTLTKKLKLNQDKFYMSDIFDFGIGKKIICFGTSNTWKFYDLLTFKEVEMTPDSSSIKFGEYQDILSFQSVIIFGKIVYDISYDQILNKVHLIQRNNLNYKYYTLPIKDHRFRQSFLKGKALIADDNNHSDKYVYLYSIENILCRDNEHITNNLQCVQCKSNEYFKNDICVGCPQGTFVENNICTACMQGCILCNNKSTCIICDQGYYINDLKECNTCNAGYYINTRSNLCEKCDDNCQTCENGIVNNQCITCNNNQVLLQTKKCVDNCDNKQYEDLNKKCQQCDPTCLTCSNSNTCDTCEEGSYLKKSTQKCELMNVKNVFRDSIYLMDSVVMKFIAKRILTQTKMSAKLNVLKINLKIQRLIHAILAIPHAKDARKQAILNAWSAKMDQL